MAVSSALTFFYFLWVLEFSPARMMDEIERRVRQFVRDATAVPLIRPNRNAARCVKVAGGSRSSIKLPKRNASVNRARWREIRGWHMDRTKPKRNPSLNLDPIRIFLLLRKNNRVSWPASTPREQ